EAAFVLQSAYRFFPKGTIHVAVVDPGVGSRRRPLLVQTQDYFFIAPDNGVLELIFRENEVKVYYLNDPKYFFKKVSNTFHGRDVFAPVAAHLTLGIPPEKLGIEIDDFKRLEWPLPQTEGNILKGEIIYIDHFGNLITNISQGVFQHFVNTQPFSIKIKEVTLNQVVSHYLAVPPGKFIAIWDSSGYLEIACSLGNAKEKLGVRVGEKIEVELLEK
ncbi:MAG: SAM-dependent chlorinase/fluorinase, partial [Candidatus Desulfofervidaceae bacterium]|nr:SAM-dependent chlorinase/fluorinase [Candidatus Desulfofervidaceae bacterium]